MKIGTSSDIVFSILTSILLKYSLKVLEWESMDFLSLVTGRLPPSYDAKRLILSNLVTTLSFLAIECVLFFLITTIYDSMKGFFALIRINELTCAAFNDFAIFAPTFFVVRHSFGWAGWVLFEWALYLVYLLMVAILSWSADGPSVLTLRSLKRSGVRVFLVRWLGFFLCTFLC